MRTKRENETLDIDCFEVGNHYSRHEIANIGRVSPLYNNKEWTGIVEFANVFLLFVTLIKPKDRPKEHHYLDFFRDSDFFWDSQSGQDQNHPQILRIIENQKKIVLFCRSNEKIKSKTQSFTYCGELIPEAYQDNKPVKFRFFSLEYDRNVNDVLNTIYDWKPSNKRSLLTIQNHNRIETLIERLKKLQDTESEAKTKRRREQQILTEILFHNKSVEICSICHKELPVILLHAAHIKKRAQCSSEEKKDPKIVMPLCKIGCDDLFEHGFILVNEEGYVTKNQNKFISKDLDTHIGSLEGLKCISFCAETAKYFKDRYISNISD
jgi:hypothetical protein